MSTNFTLKRGEEKPLQITLTQDGDPYVLPVTGELFLGFKKRKSDTVYSFSHLDGDFDKSDRASGIYTVVLTSYDTDLNPGVYVGELMATLDDGTIDKSVDITLSIEAPVIITEPGS